VAAVDARTLGPRPFRAGIPIVAPLGVLLALACGAIVAVDPKQGIGVVAGIAVVLIVAADARYLPILLTFTIFVESVSVGSGLRVGRIGAALAVALVAAYLLFRGRSGLRFNALLAVVLAYGLWLLGSTYWADYPSYTGHAVAEYGLAVAYMLAFAVLVRSPRQLYQIAATIVIGSFVFGLYGVYQYVSHTGLGGDRAYGLQGAPDLYGVYQAIAPPFVLALAARDRSRRWPLYHAAIAVIILSIVASLTRTAMLVFALIAIATIVLPWRTLFRSRAAKHTYLFALVVASALAVAVGSTTLISRAETIFHTSPTGDRGAGRTDLWRAAEHAYRDHPWLGLGGGNFAAESLDYLQTTPGVDTTRQYVRADRPVHNAYLEQLTNLGPLGLALFLAILALTVRTYLIVLRRARASRQRAIERFTVALLVSLGGFCVAGIFLSNQTLKPFWIIIGLALALDVMTRRARSVPAVTMSLPEGPYSLAVTDVTEDGALEARRAELRAEENRIERKRRAVNEFADELRSRALALAQREQRLVEREQMLVAAAAAAAPQPAVEAPAPGPEPELEAVEPVVEEAPRTAPVAPPPPPEPEAVEEPEPEPEPELQEPPGAFEAALRGGLWHLATLERLNEVYGAQEPERADERGYYVYYLADFTDEDGYLDTSFNAVVEDVFGELIERARAA
jgi:O-antigen ligase